MGVKKKKKIIVMRMILKMKRRRKRKAMEAKVKKISRIMKMGTFSHLRKNKGLLKVNQRERNKMKKILKKQ